VVQKALYPEGDGVCHAIIVHPPGGIAGGDELQLEAQLRTASHALLTTPGAGKWYRSTAAWARQQIEFDIGRGACIEWLPQENIFFDGAYAELSTTVRLARDAIFIGWEVYCLGRSGSGEKIYRGKFRWRMLIERDGRPLWFENSRLDDAAALQSPALLAGQTVVGVLTAAAQKLDSSLLGACRALQPATGDGAVTLLPGLLVGRYLGASSEAAKNFFISLWRILRPAIMARQAVEPRIWRT
jgi:urease accessory protein